VTFSGGDVEIIDMVLADTANGLSLKDLEVRGKLRVAAVSRNGRTLIPDAGFAFAAGDLVVAAAKHGVLGRVKDYLIDVEPELA
jgi:Trk K+ transport system NAD-binding subunit